MRKPLTNTTTGRLALLLTCLALSGCNSATTISGEVTYDGKPIEKGSISFAPADGMGPSAGAVIRDGKYLVEKVTPGKKKVAVQATDTSFDPASAKPERLPSGLFKDVENRELVPPDAGGNFQEYEVTPGAQTLDMHLTPPGS